MLNIMNELLVDLNSDEKEFHSSAVLLLILSIFTKHQKILNMLKLIFFFAFSTHIRSSVFTNAGVRDLQVHRPDFCFETNSSTLSRVLAFTFFSC